jgi:lipoprotein
MRHDGVSTAILASSCDMMTGTHPTFFAFRFPFLAYGLQVIILSLLLRAFHVGALRLHEEKDK